MTIAKSTRQRRRKYREVKALCASLCIHSVSERKLPTYQITSTRLYEMIGSHSLWFTTYEGALWMVATLMAGLWAIEKGHRFTDAEVRRLRSEAYARHNALY